MTTSTSSRTDSRAVLALVLAFLVPPVGLLVALFATSTEPGQRSGLRTAAIAVGVIGTILGTLLAVWFGAILTNGNA